jgi:hypothetical protein
MNNTYISPDVRRNTNRKPKLPKNQTQNTQNRPLIQQFKYQSPHFIHYPPQRPKPFPLLTHPINSIDNTHQNEICQKNSLLFSQNVEQKNSQQNSQTTSQVNTQQTRPLAEINPTAPKKSLFSRVTKKLFSFCLRNPEIQESISRQENLQQEKNQSDNDTFSPNLHLSMENQHEDVISGNNQPLLVLSNVAQTTSTAQIGEKNEQIEKNDQNKPEFHNNNHNNKEVIMYSSYLDLNINSKKSDKQLALIYAKMFPNSTNNNSNEIASQNLNQPHTASRHSKPLNYTKTTHHTQHTQNLQKNNKNPQNPQNNVPKPYTQKTASRIRLHRKLVNSRSDSYSRVASMPSIVEGEEEQIGTDENIGNFGYKTHPSGRLEQTGIEQNLCLDESNVELTASPISSSIPSHRFFHCNNHNHLDNTLSTSTPTNITPTTITTTQNDKYEEYKQFLPENFIPQNSPQHSLENCAQIVGNNLPQNLPPNFVPDNVVENPNENFSTSPLLFSHYYQPPLHILASLPPELYPSQLLYQTWALNQLGQISDEKNGENGQNGEKNDQNDKEIIRSQLNLPEELNTRQDLLEMPLIQEEIELEEADQEVSQGEIEQNDNSLKLSPKMSKNETPIHNTTSSQYSFDAHLSSSQYSCDAQLHSESSAHEVEAGS